MILKETVSSEELNSLEKWKKATGNDLADYFDGDRNSERYKDFKSHVSTFNDPYEHSKNRFSYISNKYKESESERIDMENMKFIDKKVKFCHTIYSLLVNICKGNYENEIYTFNLIPMFLIHVSFSYS